MHPAHLRIHPARPGGGSRAPSAGPSGRPALSLPGGPGEDTGGRAPGLPLSFHFESTLRKFAKLVSRWLLRASREGAAHQPAAAPAPGGSRWPQHRLRWAGVGSWAGPGRGGGCDHHTARRPRRRISGWAVSFASAPATLSLPAPGPAPPPPSRSLFNPGWGGEEEGASQEVRAPMISMETWGRGPGGDWTPAPSLAASAPCLRGGRGPGGAALNYCSRVPSRCCQESFVQFLWAECDSSLALHLAGLI